MFGERTVDINRKTISKAIDNNKLFWNKFIEAFKDRSIKVDNAIVKTVLKPHQVEATDSINKSIQLNHRSMKVISPTGTGKSLIIAASILENL